MPQPVVPKRRYRGCDWGTRFGTSGCTASSAWAFRLRGKECPCAAREGFQATLIGWVLKSLRLWKKPLYWVNPLRNKLHNKEQPIWVSEELIYKSCFSSASAKLQLGVSSVASECFNKSPNSSVTNGRLATVSYISDLGWLIFPIVDNITCPVCWLLPKSSQYLGSLP